MKSKDTRKSDDKTKGILDAALAVFTEAGYHNARIEDIANLAGVAKGTVYLYFPGKKELFGALFEKTMQDQLAIAKQALNSEGTLRDRLTRLVKNQLALLNSRKDLARFNLQEALISNKDFGKTMFRFREKQVRLIASALAKSADDQSLSEVSFRDAAVAFTGLFQAFAMEIISGRRDLKVDELAEKIVGLFLDGLERRSVA